MRKPEQRLWDRLRKAAVGKIYTERIENLVGVGRPDLDTLVAGSFVPIELKQIAAWPVRVGTRVMGERGLSQVQKNWHLTWRRWGGNSLVVVGVGFEVFMWLLLACSCLGVHVCFCSFLLVFMWLLLAFSCLGWLWCLLFCMGVYVVVVGL
jgi:hypothetical protein